MEKQIHKLWGEKIPWKVYNRKILTWEWEYCLKFLPVVESWKGMQIWYGDAYYHQSDRNDPFPWERRTVSTILAASSSWHSKATSTMNFGANSAVIWCQSLHDVHGQHLFHERREVEKVSISCSFGKHLSLQPLVIFWYLWVKERGQVHSCRVLLEQLMWEADGGHQVLPKESRPFSLTSGCHSFLLGQYPYVTASLFCFYTLLEVFLCEISWFSRRPSKEIFPIWRRWSQIIEDSSSSSSSASL